jgi:hypothetical protein
MKTPGKVSAFMEQEPRKVAAFVWDCMGYRPFEAPDLLPYFTREKAEQLGLDGYKLIHFLLIMMSLLMSLVLSLMPMEPRLAPFTGEVHFRLTDCNEMWNMIHTVLY